MENESMGDKLTDLLRQWDVCYNIFFKITKDELSLKVKEVEHQLKQHNYNDAADGISELGGVLEKVHDHLQDLGSIYNKMWSVVSDNNR